MLYMLVFLFVQMQTPKVPAKSEVWMPHIASEHSCVVSESCVENLKPKCHLMQCSLPLNGITQLQPKGWEMSRIHDSTRS